MMKLINFVKVIVSILWNLTKLTFTKFDAKTLESIIKNARCYFLKFKIMISKSNWFSLRTIIVRVFKLQKNKLTMTRCVSKTFFWYFFNWFIRLRVSFKSFWMRFSSKTFDFSRTLSFDHWTYTRMFYKVETRCITFLFQDIDRFNRLRASQIEFVFFFHIDKLFIFAKDVDLCVQVIFWKHLSQRFFFVFFEFEKKKRRK